MRNEYLTTETLEELGNFKIRGRSINIIKYTDDVIAADEAQLQNMINRFFDCWKRVRHGDHCGEIKSDKDIETTTRVQTMIGQK